MPICAHRNQIDPGPRFPPLVSSPPASSFCFKELSPSRPRAKKTSISSSDLFFPFFHLLLQLSTAKGYQKKVPFLSLILFTSGKKKPILFFLRHAVDTLPLHLVQEIKVALVEVVDTNVTVLTTRAVALAGGVGGDGVEGTEVTTDTANLVLEDLVVETGLELTLAGRGTGDIHGGLTTTEDDEVLLGCDCSAVEGGVGGVGLDDLEVTGTDEL